MIGKKDIDGLLNNSAKYHRCDTSRVLQGGHIRTRLDILKPNLCQRVERQQSHQKNGHDSNRSRVFSEGERVYARGLGLDPFHIWSDSMTIDW